MYKPNSHNSPQTIDSQDELKERLSQLTLRTRKIHQEKEVILPDKIAPISEKRLFRTTDSHKGIGRRVLELGSGWGEFCYDWMLQHPEDEYVALELKHKRIYTTIRRIRSLPKPVHFRIIAINFNWFLKEILPPQSFDLIFINFPDPWPKRRHWKHRLVKNGFDEQMKVLLRPLGLLYLATDYSPYARKILSSMRNSSSFQSVLPCPHYQRIRWEGIPQTYFESRSLMQKKNPFYFCWKLDGEGIAASRH